MSSSIKRNFFHIKKGVSMDIQFTGDDWNEITASTVYSYAGKSVKSHKSVFVISMIFILLIVAVSVYLTVTGEMDKGKIAILFFVSFLLVVAYIVKKLQFDAMKALTQYYVDSNNDCYKIKFTKISAKKVRVERHYSLIPLVGEVKTFLDAMEKLKVKEGYMEEAYQDAQNKALGYYYVKRFKQGVKDWDWLNGGEAKVVYLGKIDEVHIPAAYKSQSAPVLKDNFVQ